MAEKKIDITAKPVNGKVTTKEYKTSVSIKEIAAKINKANSQTQIKDPFKDIENTVEFKEVKSDVIKNKQYQTGKFDTKLKVIVTGLGEEAIPNDSNFKRINELFTKEDSIALTPIKNLVDSTNGFTESLIFVMEHVRVFTELLKSIEAVSINSLKPLFTEYTTFDDFNSAAAYKRFFISGAICTDDYCQICPDDDQTATFTKVVKDDYSVQEALSKFYSTIRFDQTTNTELINLFLSRPLSNEFSYDDESYRDVSKAELDNLNTPEVIVKDYGLNKLNSTGNFTELFVKAINTNYNSQIQDSFDELQKIDVNKRLLSEKESVVFDFVTRVWNANRSLNSTFSYSDFITKKDVNKGLEIEFSSVDTPVMLSEKTLLTSNNLVEDFLDPVSGFFRVFTDQVDATDDFNEVELDDDQTAVFTKVLKDNNDISELLTFDTSTVYKDLSLSSEEISNLNFKVLSSDFSQEDFVANNVDKVLLDSFNSNDVNFFEVNSIQSSQYTATDILDRVFNSLRSFDDESITNTLLSSLVNTVQNSQTINTDDFSRIVNYNIELESLSLINDQPIFNLDYNLNTISNSQDQSSFNLANKLITQYSVTEFILNNPQKLIISQSSALEELLTDKFISRRFEDEHQAQDSGLINNQNYFAEAYVEPGYVGTNRIIT